MCDEIEDEEYTSLKALAFVEEKTINKKSERCFICDKKIQKGEEVYQFRFFDDNIDFYAKKELFEKSKFYENYQKLFLKNNYTIEAFTNISFDEKLFKDEKEINQIVEDFSFEKAKSLILNIEEVKNSGKDVTKLLTILIKCGYGDKLYEELETYPKEALILFALLDDKKFQEKVSEILNTPLLPKALDSILRQAKPKVKDFEFIIEFSKNNQEFLEILSKGLKKYKLHYLYSLNCEDVFSSLHRINHCYLVYFFIMQPQLLALYNEYINYRWLPIKHGFDSDTYMECYYYRASLFYILENKPEELEYWLEEMPKSVQYYHSGSPKGFINETIKLIKQQGKYKINSFEYKNPWNKYKKRRDDFKYYKELNPNEAAIYEEKAELFKKCENHEAALLNYNKALELNPKDYILVKKSDCLYKLLKFEKAEEILNKIIDKGKQKDSYFAKCNPTKKTEIYYKKIDVLQKLGKNEQVIACFDELVKTDEKNYQLFVKRGDYFQKTKKYDEAVKEYEKAISLCPKSSYDYIYGCITSVYVKQKNVEKALFYFDKTLEYCRYYKSSVYCNKGDFFYDLNRYEEAKKCYERAIKENPKDANTFGNYARLLMTIGDFNKAIQCIETSMVLNKEKENSLLLELSFYFYCILNKNYEKVEDKIEYLLSKNIRSENFDLNKVVKKVIELGNKRVAKLEELNKRITLPNFITQQKNI